MAVIAGVLGIFLAFVGLGGALIFCWLNRAFRLEFTEFCNGTKGTWGIRFKRSVIENVDVNQENAHQVCTLVQNLIDS